MDTATGESHNPYPVMPTGFLIGSYIAFALFGIHLTQLHTYFTTYSDPFRTRALVSWIFLLSSLQMAIILGSGWKYFVDGIEDTKVWGTFLWPLSFQDGLIPMMAFTGQLFFGRRAWIVMGKKRWFGLLVVILPTITLACGIALAVTARIWSQDPYVSTLEWAHTTRTIGIPSQVVAIVWMGLSAVVDGGITLTLILRLRPHRDASPRIVSRLIALTLETVLLTHMAGAAMCIIFLASDPRYRTGDRGGNLFWVLIEVITELYALSMLFTINSRRHIRGDTFSSEYTTDAKSGPVNGESMLANGFGVSEVERRVEGYQGDTPFGVVINVPPLDYGEHGDIDYEVYSAPGDSERANKGSRGSAMFEPGDSTGSSSAPSPMALMTPGDELDGLHVVFAGGDQRGQGKEV